MKKLLFCLIMFIIMQSFAYTQTAEDSIKYKRYLVLMYGSINEKTPVMSFSDWLIMKQNQNLKIQQKNDITREKIYNEIIEQNFKIQQQKAIKNWHLNNTLYYFNSQEINYIASSELQKINNNIRAGKILLVTGFCENIVGVIIAVNMESTNIDGPIALCVFGSLSMLVGLPMWIYNVDKKADFNIKLTQYYKGGGVALTLKF